MHYVLAAGAASLISVNAKELEAMTNAVAEVCERREFTDAEFQARMGVPRSALRGLLNALRSEPHPSRREVEANEVWAEPGGSVMVRVVTPHGDPVELATHEAEELIRRLRTAIDVAT
jgi:transcription initiation factor IIE alpha subunit